MSTLIFTLCLFALAVLNTADAEAAPTPGTDLKVMSFNLRYANLKDEGNLWEERREIIFDLLKEQKPDVIGTQEGLKRQIDDLLEALPEYEAFGVARSDGKTEGEHSKIFYNRRRFKREDGETFWFSDTPEKIGSKSWGNTVVRICTWVRLKEKSTGRRFYVYNLHIDHESQPSRERSVKLLLERIRSRKHPDPVLVTGDFNAGEDNPAVEAMIADTGLDLRDTFRVAHPDEKVAGTFNGFQGRTDGEKIDYVFASPEFQVRKAVILRTNRDGRYPSDHFPITADLRLSTTKK